MSKITITGHVVGYHFDHMRAGEVTWGFSVVSPSKTDSRVIHSFEHSFDVEVPDNLNIVATQLAAIEREKEAARAEFTARMSELNEQASKLMALEMA